MKVITHWLWEMPKQLEGLVFVIDAFGATTNIAMCLQKEVKRLLLVSETTIDRARVQHPEYVLMGESKIFPRDFFAVGNDLKRVASADLTGKEVIYMSINGTKAVEEVLQRGVRKVFTLSFTNISAAISFVKNKSHSRQITLILSGDDGSQTVEDRLCADAFTKILNGDPVNWDRLNKEVISFMEKFYGAPPTDENTTIVLSRDIHPVVPACEIAHDGFIEVTDASK